MSTRGWFGYSSPDVHDETARSAIPADPAEPIGLVASVQAVPLFFGGWVLVGLAVSWHLIRRGHDVAPALALGVGLGPLALLVVGRPAAQADDDSSAGDDEMSP